MHTVRSDVVEYVGVPVDRSAPYTVLLVLENCSGQYSAAFKDVELSAYAKRLVVANSISANCLDRSASARSIAELSVKVVADGFAVNNANS